MGIPGSIIGSPLPKVPRGPKYLRVQSTSGFKATSLYTQESWDKQFIIIFKIKNEKNKRNEKRQVIAEINTFNDWRYVFTEIIPRTVLSFLAQWLHQV